VTLGLAMAACGESHEPNVDAGPVDARVVTPDAGDPCPEGFPETEECCEMWGGVWDDSWGCGVPGPFVPPAMA